MKKTFKYMSILLIALTFSTAYVVKADEISSNQNKLNNVNSSISDKKKQLDTINKNSDVMQQDIKTIDTQVADVSKQLAALNSKISGLNNDISLSAKELSKHEEDLNKENQAFKNRLRAMYISGNTAYLDVVFEANSFSDMFSRIELVSKIIEYDKKLTEEIKKNKRNIEVKKSELEKQKKSVVQLKVQADEQNKALQAKSIEKKTMMSSLQKDKKAYEQLIAEEEAESQNIAAMIKKLKDDAAKAQQQNNSGSQPSRGGTSPVKNGKIYCVTGSPYIITSGYGWRVHPVLGYQRFHAGIDLGVPMGTPIYALSDGIVEYSGSMSGYGNVVMVNHGNITSLYAHNSSLVVSVGQAIKGGQLIAYSGNTGLSSGPHLHFEIRDSNGNTMDPNSYYVK